MTISNLRSKRKPTGGKYQKQRKKMRKDFGSDFLPAKVSTQKKKTIRTFGGNFKIKLMGAEKANVTIDGKTKIVKILSVKENRANPNFVRMNVVTKGAIIETDAGLAKVTSRPGQGGVINAVAVKA
jgi:small subunit ribosomal protein S8e